MTVDREGRNIWETPQKGDIVRIDPDSFTLQEMSGLNRAGETFHEDEEQLYTVLEVIPAQGDQRRALKTQKVEVKTDASGKESIIHGESMGNITPAIEHFVVVMRWDGKRYIKFGEE